MENYPLPSFILIEIGLISINLLDHAHTLAFVIAKLKAVIEIFRGLAGIVEGVVFVIGGIFMGDWKAVWLGAKKIVFSTINSLIGVISAFVEAIASVVDAVASVFGADFGAADAVRKLRREVETGLAKGLKIETDKASGAAPGLREISTEPSAKSATAVNPQGTTAESDTFLLSSPAVSEAKARTQSDDRVAQAISQNSSITREFMDRISSRPVNVRLDVDGDTLASTTVKVQRESAIRSFAPTPGI